MSEDIKLFCIPYAGGSAMIYKKYQKYLEPFIKVIPIELTGRGIRMKESLNDNVTDQVNDIYDRIEDELDGTRFAIFSHSMGTLLAYELIYKIKELKHQVPIHGFFSGRYTPDAGKNKECLYSLPDEKFIKMIKEIGGTPEQFFENRDLMQLFIPILKADYKLVECYEYQGKAEKFDFDITVMGGTQDKIVTCEELERWREFTYKECDIKIYNGGHFYLFEQIEAVCDLINMKILNCLKNDSPLKDMGEKTISL